MLEAFKVGILIALNNRASYGLGIIARDFAKTDVQAKKLQQTIKNVSLLTLGGAGLMAAGFLGLRAADSWMQAATRYTQAYARFQALNLGASVNRDADHFARSAKLMGVSATSLMTTITDLHTVFGNYGHARAMAPLVSRMEFANKAVFGDATKFNTNQAQLMGKVIEMRGGFKSEADMRSQIDFMQHVKSGTGGRVMPSDYYAFIQTAGAAGRLQTSRNFFYGMEPLIQEMGGRRVGTALMSAYQNLGQGRTTVRTARELMRLGLVAPGAAEFNSLGQLNRIKPGGIAGGDMVAADPMNFLRTILLPAFARKGITGEKAILNEIATIFTNRTAASLFSLIYLQAAKIDKNVRVDQNAMGVAGLLRMGDKTPMGIQARVQASWENLKTMLGLKVIPVVLPLLERLANGLQSLASAAERHPTLTKWLVLTAMGLSAVAVVVGGIAVAAGAVLLIAAAIGGGVSAGIVLAITAVVTGITVLGTALVAFWPKIKDGLVGVALAVGGFFAFLWSKIPDWMKRFFGVSAGASTTAPLSRAATPGPWSAPTLPGGAANATELAGAIKAALNGAHVKLDGKAVGRIVTDHQGQVAARPSTGATAYDSSWSPLRANMQLNPGG